MIKNLRFPQLLSLLQTVFAIRSDESCLTIFVDLPSAKLPDSTAWQDRRTIAIEWYRELKSNISQTGFSCIRFCGYENVGSNNNDLPPTVHVIEDPNEAMQITELPSVQLDEVLKNSSIVLAMTELSATAPLKILARKYGFRGATLPGFSREMIPSLALDYEKIHARVLQFKDRMDRATGISVRFSANGKEYESYFDLRFRTGHASGGLIREPGMMANLPSGEAYIVPYEGERSGEPSKTAGLLPVQFSNEVVVYKLVENRAVSVTTGGEFSQREKTALIEEPAYGNIAEVGIGILGDWGVKAVGSTLLDEKLGLHIAFGRSEHFGGITSPASFRDPGKVVHIDRVYVPSVQPLVTVQNAAFLYPTDASETIMKSGRYVV